MNQQVTSLSPQFVKTEEPIACIQASQKSTTMHLNRYKTKIGSSWESALYYYFSACLGWHNRLSIECFCVFRGISIVAIPLLLLVSTVWVHLNVLDLLINSMLKCNLNCCSIYRWKWRRSQIISRQIWELQIYFWSTNDEIVGRSIIEQVERCPVPIMIRENWTCWFC